LNISHAEKERGNFLTKQEFNYYILLYCRYRNHENGTVLFISRSGYRLQGRNQVMSF